MKNPEHVTRDAWRGPSVKTEVSGVDGSSYDWTALQKIALPHPIPGQLDRSELLHRAMPTRRRLTVLQAPGGFGKTTLLAECCRRMGDEGVPTAWVSVDEQDEPMVFDMYIAYACRSALADRAARWAESPRSTLDAADGGTGGRTGIALREIAEFGGPFVLILDELERLAHADSVALLDALLRRAPPNMHLAFACRQLPVSLDIASAVLDKRAEILFADDLRFSKSEVAHLFDGKLSPDQLARVMSESAGWPFAVRISLNDWEVGGRRLSLVEGWVESRLFARLDSEDREFLLDIGLFESMDAALLDEVLQRSDSMRRLDTMPEMVGLIEPSGGGGGERWRLHPLVREHCARRRFRETPQRFRAIHRRIADALARRRMTAAAMRHAVEAGEPELAGEILERAGGILVAFTEGYASFLAAHRWLSEDVIRARPRLAHVRCLALILSGRMEEARLMSRSTLGLFLVPGDNSDDAEWGLAAETFIVRGMLVLYGGARLEPQELQASLEDWARLARSPRIDSRLRGHLINGLCIAYTMAAQFDAGRKFAAEARRHFRENPFMTMYIDVQMGQAAMGQGQVRDAAAQYQEASQIAKNSYLLDVVPSAICAVLSQELSLERGHDLSEETLTRVPLALVTHGSPLQVYQAACSVAVDLRLRIESTDGALVVADEMLDYARGAELQALVRFLAALRVSLLTIAGRAEEARKAWALDGLPEEYEECLDLAGQNWRAMEALSCACLRLMISLQEFEAGREFARKLCKLAAARGLKRTLMRALVLCMVLELRSGDETAARSHLEAYLRLFGESPYAGPLVRDQADCAQLVARIAESFPEASVRASAQSILGAMQRAEDYPRRSLSERELQVLRRLELQQDKQIAKELGITPYGVRYHIRKLFTKLGARRRAEAVRRAREMGILEEDRVAF